MNLSENIYLKFILRHNNRHNVCNIPIAAFVYDFSDKKQYYINFSHPDLPPSDITYEQFKQLINKKNVYVRNKKSYKYWLEDINLIDINLLEFIESNELQQISDVDFKLQIYNKDINDWGIIVPYVLHQSAFDQEIKDITDYHLKKYKSYCFNFFNNVVTDTLYFIEKNGLKIDSELFKKYFKGKIYSNDFVYSEYHIYNATGRPSNSYDGINYAALKKDDGSRSSFISRFDNGYMLLVDFTGFHPYIVANLIDYKVPDQETIYEHLAKQYFNAESVDEDLIKKSKKLTMVNLYGQIKQTYAHIPYFEKTETLKNKYWEEFSKKGYVKTPIYKRKITEKHIIDANKNKLFSYIIQAAETEYGIERLKYCIEFISDKNIVPLLYTYDSILFDIDSSVKYKDIEDLVNIIKNNKFKVKVYSGKNYNDLKLINI